MLVTTAMVSAPQCHAACCRGGPQSSLMFCTNGVLLRMLTRGDGLSNITHVCLKSEFSQVQQLRAVSLLLSATCAAWLESACFEVLGEGDPQLSLGHRYLRGIFARGAALQTSC